MARTGQPAVSKPKRKATHNPLPKVHRKKMPRLRQSRRGLVNGRVYEEAYCARARKLALLGLVDAEIAEILGISRETFYAWKTEHPEFARAVNEGKIAADAEVTDSLYNRAIGGIKVSVTKAFLDPGAKQPVYAKYEQTLPPDVVAQKVWLFNRQPHRWRDRRERTVMSSIEHRISLMTPEQKRERLKELQAMAQRELDGEWVEVPEEVVEAPDAPQMEPDASAKGGGGPGS